MTQAVDPILHATPDLLPPNPRFVVVMKFEIAVRYAEGI